MTDDARNRLSRASIRLRTADLAPTVVGLVAAFALTATRLNWRRPVLEHDDWDMVLPNGPAFVLDHAQRVLHEGRWLNYWWWQLGSQRLGPVAVTVGFGLAWLVVTGILTRTLTRTWWAVPIAVALYASPMMGQISYWPATMLAPTTALALGSLAIALTRHRWRLHLLVVVGSMLVMMLAYPPFALLLAPLLLALHARASWRRLAWLAVAFAGTYVAGIVVVFALNAARFGVFGIQIQSWRHPTALSGPTALWDHLVVVLHNNVALAEVIALPLLAVAAGVVMLVLRGDRRRIAVLALAYLLTLGLSSASTILSGVDVPFRSAGWVWPFGVIAVAWALEGASRPQKLVAGVALIAIAVWAAAYWVELARGHQRYESVMDRIQDRVVQLYDRGDQRIVFIPRVSYESNIVDVQTAWQLGNALRKEDGIDVAGHCVACAGPVAYARAHAPESSVLLHKDTVLVRFPAGVLREALDAQPMPRWLTPLD